MKMGGRVTAAMLTARARVARSQDGIGFKPA
jgi:hypothetical protein